LKYSNFIFFIPGLLANKDQGPGSIQHRGGKCIHILLGGYRRPKEGQPLVVYQGCGQGRLEFQLFTNGTLMHTRHSMCVKPIGTVTDGAKVGKLGLKCITLFECPVVEYVFQSA
jgi:hypothetical protein